jgi:hypothetical protein
MLRELFIEFDKSSIFYKVYKVYTIGGIYFLFLLLFFFFKDCYVVLGMNNINSRCVNEEAKNVVNMGFSMINTIIAVRNRVNNTDL